MTPEEIDLSTIRITGPPPGYNSEQGELSDFDWMVYQLKELEKILGKERTAEWLTRPTKEFRDRTPASVALKSCGDFGCRAVALLIRDMITDAPERDRIIPVSEDELKKTIEQELPVKQKAHTILWGIFEALFHRTDGPSQAVDLLMECIMLLVRNLSDGAWDEMLKAIMTISSDMPRHKSIQETLLLMKALDRHRTYIGELTKDQEGNIKIVG